MVLTIVMGVFSFSCRFLLKSPALLESESGTGWEAETTAENAPENPLLAALTAMAPSEVIDPLPTTVSSGLPIMASVSR